LWPVGVLDKYPKIIGAVKSGGCLIFHIIGLPSTVTDPSIMDIVHAVDLSDKDNNMIIIAFL
jgi:hypothetical protein